MRKLRSALWVIAQHLFGHSRYTATELQWWAYPSRQKGAGRNVRASQERHAGNARRGGT